MVVPDFKSKIIFLDTAPLIYFIEGRSPYQTILEQLFTANDNREFLFQTSTTAEMRAKYNLRTPDALQLSVAIEHKADYFLTNDTRLKAVTEIQSVILSDLQ